MDSAEIIRAAVARVNHLRAARQANPLLADAVVRVKQFQSRRFAFTYADLLAQRSTASSEGAQREAALFFMTELYGDADYSQRDAQFSRIAGTLQKVFPKPVVSTAIALAQLHLLSEELDHAMGLLLLIRPPESSKSHVATPVFEVSTSEFVANYVVAWRALGRFDAREQQLFLALQIGQDLNRLTRKPGLRLMLKMMRQPARAAGMGDLQHFLENGFDTFGALAKSGGQAKIFLNTIQTRESILLEALCKGTESDACRLLGAATSVG